MTERNEPSLGATRAAIVVLAGSEHGAIRWHGPDARNQWCWQYRHHSQVAALIDQETGLPELVDNLTKTTIFLETVVRNLSQMREVNSPQRTFLEAHIELNRAAITAAHKPVG